jgi:hypothetical protein
MRYKEITFISLILVFVLGIAFGNVPMALGLEAEVEPNNPCSAAQVFVSATLPFTLNGSLDTPPDTPDVDFFKFTGMPAGTIVRVDVEGVDTGKGTLSDPYLGYFDTDCTTRIAFDDDSGGGLNSRLIFTIPDSGQFVLAASSCCDEYFDGTGGSSGTYQLTVTLAPLIGSISGRVVDAEAGNPLPGDAEPFTWVFLYRCFDGSACTSNAPVEDQFADSAGRFRFDPDISGNLLEPGWYQLAIYANQYQYIPTDPFEVAAFQDLDLGDVPLQPYPIQFSNVTPCENLPSTGGTCTYSVRVRNSSEKLFTGLAWSPVQGFYIGSLSDYTLFQTLPVALAIKPGTNKVARFSFYVPGSVADGAFICPLIFVGKGLHPFFNTVNWRELFCISKEATGAFSVVPEKETQKMFRQMKERMLIPSKRK